MGGFSLHAIAVGGQIVFAGVCCSRAAVQCIIFYIFGALDDGALGFEM